jgi:hypothetical protein
VELRAVAPAMRLVVHDLVAQDDRVVARIEVSGSEGAGLHGWPMLPQALWGRVEIFRVEGESIAERWTESADLVSLSELLTVTVPVAPPLGKTLTLERWIYDPGTAETRARELGFLVLFVQTGTLTVRTSAEPAKAKRLGARDMVVVPVGGSIDVRNDGMDAVDALAIVAEVPEPQIGARTGDDPPDGITRTVLAGMMTVRWPDGGAEISVARAVLGSSAEIGVHRVGVVELVAVEAGTLAVTVEGDAWVSSDPTRVLRRFDGAPLLTGGGARIVEGATVGYHASGGTPATLLLLTVSPASTPDAG